MKQEKIELPKTICGLLDDYSLDYRRKYPLDALKFITELMETSEEASEWLKNNTLNQWKLINSIRNGYIPEKE